MPERIDQSQFWTEHSKRLDALSVDDLSFVHSRAVSDVIWVQRAFNWELSGRREAYARLDVPEANVDVGDNTVMCKAEASILVSEFPELRSPRVLEVGGGFGNFCRVLHHAVSPAEYTLLDTPSMLRLAEAFLRAHGINDCEFMASTEIERLRERQFDLFVSNICLSEMLPEYRKRLLELALPRCSYCFVIDGDGRNTEYNGWLGKQVKACFSTVRIFPVRTPWKNQKAFVGEK